MISVITPTYNCAKYLLRSYECLRRQTYKDWEWVIVNDGSEDDTDVIISSLAQQDSRIKKFTLDKNRGRGYARNFATEKARGSIIVVWDVDDFYTSERLAEINKSISSGYDYFCSYALIADNNLNLKGARHFSKTKERFTPSFVHPTLAFRASLKDKVVYDKSMRAGEDLGVMLHLESNYKGYCCNKYLLVYSEDREVNIAKSIEANLNQLQSTLYIIGNKVIECNIIEKVKFIIKKKFKIFVLRLLKLTPDLYLKTVRFRSCEYIDSSKLNSEHLFILSGNLNEE
ncbi:glycosyltransferase [Oceanimonas sp. GK1]|uniref:glycosyltransferase family 2 protein n=1 Tax=Oceanimonas sp. (strain GK1 / IBRC-M 10197) TaxID=511062 RepID=UPI000249525F|nr:glycosyltransferase family 2 protein [Oceanimonas sp. GK1]AEY02322.1 glycosyltransferase [Oceanimonas sp. GK1]